MPNLQEVLDAIATLREVIHDTETYRRGPTGRLFAGAIGSQEPWSTLVEAKRNLVAYLHMEIWSGRQDKSTRSRRKKERGKMTQIYKVLGVHARAGVIVGPIRKFPNAQCARCGEKFVLDDHVEENLRELVHVQCPTGKA